MNNGRKLTTLTAYETATAGKRQSSASLGCRAERAEPENRQRNTLKRQRVAHPLSVGQYESGWYVEYSDPDYSLEDCVFIQVAGPFKTEAGARRRLNKLRASHR